MPSWSSVTQLLQRHGHFLPVNKNARQVMNVFSGATREKTRNCPDKKMYGGVATTRSENVRLSQMSEQDFNARMMTLTDSFIALRNETDRREGVTYLTPEGWTQEVPALHIKTARVGSDTRYEAMVLTDCRHENVIRCFGSSEDGSELNLEAAASPSSFSPCSSSSHSPSYPRPGLPLFVPLLCQAGEHDLHARIVSQGSGRLRLNEARHMRCFNNVGCIRFTAMHHDSTRHAIHDRKRHVIYDRKRHVIYDRKRSVTCYCPLCGMA